MLVCAERRDAPYASIDTFPSTPLEPRIDASHTPLEGCGWEKIGEESTKCLDTDRPIVYDALMNIYDAITAIIDSNETLDYALRPLMIELFAPTRLDLNHIRPDTIADAIRIALDEHADDDPMISLMRSSYEDRMTLIAQLLHLADRDTLTRLALDDSLCPLHFIDYAICFDDDNDECASIRLIHPSHDT